VSKVQHLVAFSFSISHIIPVNLPNAITLSRLFLTAAFIAFVQSEHTWCHLTALILFIIAAASDFLDGWLARKMNLITPLGKLLDPLADKILVCTAFVFLTAKGICPFWATALIIAREFLVTGLRQIAIEAGHVLAADRLGKWKTTLQHHRRPHPHHPSNHANNSLLPILFPNPNQALGRWRMALASQPHTGNHAHHRLRLELHLVFPTPLQRLIISPTNTRTSPSTHPHSTD
jgi:CDP-diacylglycerol--glycerol-3-phosphate 3-phosphatidyltransferase